METFYDILQVSPNASKEVIDMAYKALAKKYHPDLNPLEDKHEAEEKMKALNAAYAVLKDEQTRAKYDSQLNFDNEANQNSDYTSWEQPQTRGECQSCHYMVVEPHPWIRYFARCFDMYISTILIVVLWVLLSPTSYSAIFGKVPEYVAGIILYIIWIFVEAILLSMWGTTPGKWLLNAKILDVNGNKLKLSIAVKRGFMVFVYGLWLLIPLATMGGLITSYNYLKRPNIFVGRSSWDVSCNSSVIVRKASAWRVVMVIFLILATLVAFQYYTSYINEKNQELVEMKQSIDNEAAALSDEEDSLNKMYEEYVDLESKLLQWQDEGDYEQFNAHYDEYEDMIQEYNDRYDEYVARLEKHNENVDHYNALIGAG